MRSLNPSLSIACVLALSGCAGIAFSKAGEDDAFSACQELADLNDDENASLEDILFSLAKSEGFAIQAAEANNDYEELSKAIGAFTESLTLGSDDLAQSAWERVARACNDL